MHDHILQTTEYPAAERILEGPCDGEVFEYVSIDYLNGIINYVGIAEAWVVGRYRTGPGAAKAHAAQARDAERGHHTKLAHPRHAERLEDADDVVVIATSHGGARVWYFYFDLDISDCCVGWTSSRTVAEVRAAAVADHPVAAEMDASKLTGWVSF